MLVDRNAQFVLVSLFNFISTDKKINIYHLIDENGRTIRGCLDNLCTGELCHECATSECNNIIFPLNRLSCYTCNDDGNCVNGQTDGSSVSELCEIYNENDNCYMLATASNNIIKRGCSSSETLCTDNELCMECKGMNCNSWAESAPAQRSCIKCTSGEHDDCKWGYSETSERIEDCENDVKFYQIESCYTNVIDDVVTRGCVLDNPSDCADGSTCTSCTENNVCNIENVVHSKCVQCSSANDNENSCGSIPTDDINVIDCTNIEIFENRGCYTSKKDDVVTRGCLNAVDDELLATCKSEDSKTCDICTDSEGCNNKEPPSSATSLKIMSLTVLVTVIISFKIIF